MFQGQINPSPGTTDVIEKSLDLPSGIDGLYYLRVYGIDGVEGPASNVLVIRIEPSGGPSEPDVDSAELFWILIGVASGLALISLIVVVVFLIRERPKCCCKGKTSAAADWVEHGDEKDRKKVDPPATIEPEEDSRVPQSIRRNPVTKPDPRQVDVNVEINSEFSGSSDSSGFTEQESSSGSVGVADLGYLEESSATWRYVVPVDEADDVAVVPERRAAPPKPMPDFNRTSPPNSTLNSRSDFREPVPDHIPTPPPSSTWNSRSGLPERIIRTSPHHSTLNSQSSACERIYDVPNPAILPPRKPTGKLSSRPTSPPPRPPPYGSTSRSSSPAYLASQAEVLAQFEDR